MKTIIAGSRGLTDVRLVYHAVEQSGWDISEVVSGGAKGIDKAGEIWADNSGIPKKIFKAEWDRYGKSAGHRRNMEMAEYIAPFCGGLLAIWDGKSRGTKDMIEIASQMQLPIFILKVSYSNK